MKKQYTVKGLQSRCIRKKRFYLFEEFFGKKRNSYGNSFVQLQTIESPGNEYIFLLGRRLHGVEWSRVI